jgi:hypothetical protein
VTFSKVKFFFNQKGKFKLKEMKLTCLMPLDAEVQQAAPAPGAE